MSDDSDESGHKVEANARERGEATDDYYAKALSTSKHNPLAQHGDGPKKKIIKPEDMPWELSPQGRLKHVVNEDMSEGLDVPVRGTDIYLQEIPPGSKSGKHRHMSEELVYVIEGDGFDEHWDPTAVVHGDTYEWEIPDDPQRFEWQTEDVVYIPTNTIHQHHNASDDRSAWLLCCQARVYNHLGYGFEDLEQFENAPEYDEQRD